MDRQLLICRILTQYLDSSERTFDDCSKSPFVYQKESTLMVTCAFSPFPIRPTLETYARCGRRRRGILCDQGRILA